MDLTSDIPNDVTAVATLESSIPLKINGSFTKKSPVFSYTVIEVLSETSLLKKAVAPLYFPFTNVGTESVVDSLRVIFVWN